MCVADPRASKSLSNLSSVSEVRRRISRAMPYARGSIAIIRTCFGGDLKAFFPGTFDPVTNGHLDIVKRASAVFDDVIVGVYRDSGKNPLFSPEERLAMIRETVVELSNVSAETYEGLTVEFANSIGARVVVRGLRAISDFEYEFSLSSMNQVIESDIETICLLTSPQLAFISSSLVKEVASFGQPVDHWVPLSVAQRVRAKLDFDPSQASLRE